LKILALVRLWQREWATQCSNIGGLVDHTSPAWARCVARNFDKGAKNNEVSTFEYVMSLF